MLPSCLPTPLRALTAFAFLLLVAATPAHASGAKPGQVERMGDALQFLLPITGAACSFGRSGLRDYALRFVALEGMIHAPKNALGDAPINLRPGGATRGFPSGHTAAAFYGASAIARTCLRESPVGQMAIWGAAMFTGGSRIEAGMHFLFQVVFGALIGLVADLGLRRRRRRARPMQLPFPRLRAWSLGSGPA